MIFGAGVSDGRGQSLMQQQTVRMALNEIDETAFAVRLTTVAVARVEEPVGAGAEIETAATIRYPRRAAASRGDAPCRS